MKQQLNEVTRQEIINKSIAADKSVGGRTRWENRDKIKVFSSASSFNSLDMNELFKNDKIKLVLPVHGETNNYRVTMWLGKVCQYIKEQNVSKLDYEIIYKAIFKAFENEDIRLDCTCDDYKYRMRYRASMNKHQATPLEFRPSDITNPHDTKGGGCKHVLSVLGDLTWLLKLSIAIYNYIKYMERSNKKAYEVIWDAISNVQFKVEEPEDYDMDRMIANPAQFAVDDPEDYDRGYNYVHRVHR